MEDHYILMEIMEKKLSPGLIFQHMMSKRKGIYMEDIKKTIEFANSNDKLDIDIKYDELRQAIKERDKFDNIVGIIFCLSFIAAIVFGIMSLRILAGICLFIVILCLIIGIAGVGCDILSESEFENVYNLFCNTINYSKDVYLKIYQNNIEISYFSKEDDSYETKNFISLTDSYQKYIRYIDDDNFKIVGRLINDVYKITLYVPVKYNKDYLEFTKQKEYT